MIAVFAFQQWSRHQNRWLTFRIPEFFGCRLFDSILPRRSHMVHSKGRKMALAIQFAVISCAICLPSHYSRLWLHIRHLGLHSYSIWYKIWAAQPPRLALHDFIGCIAVGYWHWWTLSADFMEYSNILWCNINRDGISRASSSCLLVSISSNTSSDPPNCHYWWNYSQWFCVEGVDGGKKCNWYW